MQLHAYGSNIEGSYDEVFAAVKVICCLNAFQINSQSLHFAVGTNSNCKDCHEKLHSMGVVRVHTNIKFGSRNDKSQTMDDKVQSVECKLQQQE